MRQAKRIFARAALFGDAGRGPPAAHPTPGRLSGGGAVGGGGGAVGEAVAVAGRGRQTSLWVVRSGVGRHFCGARFSRGARRVLCTVYTVQRKGRMAIVSGAGRGTPFYARAHSRVRTHPRGCPCCSSPRPRQANAPRKGKPAYA